MEIISNATAINMHTMPNSAIMGALDAGILEEVLSYANNF
jgi:hypothetical protein